MRRGTANRADGGSAAVSAVGRVSFGGRVIVLGLAQSPVRPRIPDERHRRPVASGGPAPLSLLAVVVLAGVVVACSRASDDRYFGTTDRGDKPTTTFYLNNYDEPEYLDPGLSTDGPSSTLLYDLFEGLVVKHPEDLRPTPGMAVRWDKSDDNRVFRFYLRPDAKWSDGQPVTAHDFVYAWLRVLTPATAARSATLMYALKNGQLFHQGKVMRLMEAHETVDGEQLAARAAVRLLETERANVSVSPWVVDQVAAAGMTVDYRAPGGAAKGSALAVTAGGTWAATPLAATEVSVERRGPKVTCNGAPDHWYRVALGGQHGWLPGCAIDEVDASERVLVVEHTAPSYAGLIRPRRGEPKVALVRRSALAADTSLVGVRARSDLVLEVELEKPTPYFLELCAHVTYFPVRRDVIERFVAAGTPDRWYRVDNMVNNGPYALESWRFRYEITFKRNPHHYAHDQLKVHRVVWLEVPDYNATMNLYKTGEIDFIGSNVALPAAYLSVLPKYADFSQSLYLSTYWYEVNTNKPPVDDVRVRRALNLAIDKQQLVDRITRGEQAPATHYVPDYTGSGYAEQARADKQAGVDPFSGPEVEHNPTLARELLGQAGYQVVRDGDGFRAEGFPPLEILYNTAEGHQKLAVAIQDMWKRHLGISATLRNEEWKVMLKNLRDGHYQVARFGWVADYNHPHTWLDLFLSYSNNNWTGWSSSELDALIERAASTRDPGESIRLYRQAEKLALDAMSRLPLYFYTKSTLVKPYVKGYWSNAKNDHFVRWMWIDPDWRNNPVNVPAYPPGEMPEPGRID